MHKTTHMHAKEKVTWSVLGVSEISFMLRLWAWSASDNQYMYVWRQTTQQPLEKQGTLGFIWFLRGFSSANVDQGGCSSNREAVCSNTAPVFSVGTGGDYFLMTHFLSFVPQSRFLGTNKIKEKHIPHKASKKFFHNLLQPFTKEICNRAPSGTKISNANSYYAHWFGLKPL